jgi:hypothetical protein
LPKLLVERGENNPYVLSLTNFGNLGQLQIGTEVTTLEVVVFRREKNKVMSFVHGNFGVQNTSYGSVFLGFWSHKDKTHDEKIERF